MTWPFENDTSGIVDRGCYCCVLFFNQPCQYDNHKLLIP